MRVTELSEKSCVHFAQTDLRHRTRTSDGFLCQCAPLSPHSLRLVQARGSSVFPARLLLTARPNEREFLVKVLQAVIAEDKGIGTIVAFEKILRPAFPPFIRACWRGATGRKNWLFVGSEEGGRASAIVYSIILTCRNLNIDLQAYFEDVLKRVNEHPAKDIARLLPTNGNGTRKPGGAKCPKCAWKTTDRCGARANPNAARLSLKAERFALLEPG